MTATRGVISPTLSSDELVTTAGLLHTPSIYTHTHIKAWRPYRKKDIDMPERVQRTNQNDTKTQEY